MATKKEAEPEIDVEAQNAAESLKLKHHVAGVREKLARDLGITAEEINGKQIIIKGDSIVVK